MKGSFWFFFTVQVVIPGSVLLWLMVSDVIQAWRSRPRGRSKARSRTAAPAHRWYS